ncbi:hypothetical protein HYV43_03850 [Candidatus Micrarchaeota archaeon]|nr:hypothetical protein [Candidatus Micrarchaeota archaeon]
MIVFQVLLLALLALPLAAGFMPLLGLALTYALLLGAAMYRASTFKGRDNAAAWTLTGFFAVLSLGIIIALMLAVSVFWIGIVSAVVLAVFFAALGWRYSSHSCELIGWSNGYAVVRVPQSLIAVVQPGVYAVSCAKKPAGKKMTVRFSFLKKQGVVVD